MMMAVLWVGTVHLHGGSPCGRTSADALPLSEETSIRGDASSSSSIAEQLPAVAEFYL